MPKCFLNVGGNSKAIAVPKWYGGWEHVLLDIDPAGRPDIVCDAREMTKLEGGQFDAVYCSHGLEHFYAHDVPKVLAGVKHVLKVDGFAELRMPDLGELFHTIVEQKLDIDDVLYKSGVGDIRVRDVIYGFGRQIEASGQDFYAHRTGFTRPSLRRAVAAAGFQAISFAHPRRYEIAAFAFKMAPNADQRALLSLSATANAAFSTNAFSQ
jgi:hypothetical protein